MKTSHPLVRSVAAFGILLALTVAAFAQKLHIGGASVLPNIDENGNIDLVNDGSPATLEASINTKNGKTRITVQGDVENLSNTKQKYKDDPEFNAELEEALVELKRSLYKVSVEGAASLKVSGVIDVSMLP